MKNKTQKTKYIDHTTDRSWLFAECARRGKEDHMGISDIRTSDVGT